MEHLLVRLADEERAALIVTGTKESGTHVAYLYDVGPLGLGKLAGNAPFTFHGKTPTRSTRSTSSTTRPARS